MILKWALVFIIGYFIYKKYIALPPGREEDSNANLKNRDESSLQEEDDDYIDFEEVD